MSFVNERFQRLANFINDPARTLMRKLKDLANNMIGIFVFSFDSIVATFTNLPNQFGAIFTAIGRVATTFGSSLVEKFGNIGSAIAMAIRAPFTDETLADALALATKEAFGNMDAIIAEELEKVAGASVDYGKIAGEAFSKDYVAATGEGLKTFALNVALVSEQAANVVSGAVQTGFQKITDTTQALGTATKNMVEDYRAAQTQIESNTLTNLQYDDAILRIARSQDIASQSTQDLVTETQNAVVALSGFDAFYKQLTDSASANAAELGFAMQAKALLRQELEAGRISIDVYAMSMERVNQILGITKSSTDNLTASTSTLNTQLTGFDRYMQDLVSNANGAANQINFAAQAKAVLDQQLRDGKISIDAYAQAMEANNRVLGITPDRASAAGSAVVSQAKQVKMAADIIKDANTQISFNNKQLTQNRSAVSQLSRSYRQGDISLSQFRETMKTANLDMELITDTGIQMAIGIEDAFRQAGNALASNLAKGIRTGEGLMSSFKNFVGSILDQILTMVIQKSFVDPLMNSLFGSGTGGAGGGGLLGSLLGGGGFGLFSGGRSFGNPLGSLFSGLFGGLFGGGGGLFSFLGFAQGGIVPGLPTSGDSVPALLTPGEVVLNRSQQASLLEPVQETPPPVTITINAIDTQTGTEFLLRNKREITGIVQQAYASRGRTGGPIR